MIHSNTMIHWMDVNEQEVSNITISELFRHYAHKAFSISFNEMGIIFDESDNVKVAESYGWTNVIKLKRVAGVPNEKWFVISPKGTDPNSLNEPSVVVNSRELIPIYTPSNTTRGFHGEVKYEYILKNPEKIKDGDYIRVHRGIDPNGNDVDFQKVQVRPYGMPLWGYEIVTKSSFVNGGKIHLYASDQVSIEDVAKWK